MDLGFCSKFCEVDWEIVVELIGIAVNSLLALWIINTVQKNQSDKRVLKDHLISEVIELRGLYSNHLNKLYSSEDLNPKNLLPWYKLIYIKTSDLMTLINQSFRIDERFLDPYKVGIRTIVTEDPSYTANFKKNKEFKLSEEGKTELVRFQQQNNHLFNDLVIRINKA